ncbi:class IIb bacteriocin, lactobin A/cerein 7B family [Streptococcus mitis]|nr:class IIb bacteriocin, lactobin A/cerein 7B family [Streptococcus mitis]MQQ14650.1 class IIb bacteriocin, lactobin A/cerein 7B family [Streptococcus mitis]MQQ45530.1 class IIb bacteriocin, lactobin A/cerein 7B family [Streptococcus mitis]MQQ47476.1 class IIb bacteriocin, lactobin A/cerein 7B family [Streptococcus mitis]MQQ58792.1 class IIb bacteriocin, lactobin A/cerein 7B family [Streptococcus mitis]
MIKNYETVDFHELEEIKGGFLPGALALAWGVTKAVGIVGATATTVYVGGKAVKRAGEWVVSHF